ncbi:unnamed protein product [Didymodactylos carnosus]|uniref:Uncharacterized protein n=1 Tax=Didymodactylos carnosus TaxID=1234261 RepID=A0A814W2W5_9BILA|nr:unnamed protein product [Didymodactylos carnosus]CAF3957572.1 unnamed protein product [Didymodactylos carnosus]
MALQVHNPASLQHIKNHFDIASMWPIRLISQTDVKRKKNAVTYDSYSSFFHNITQVDQVHRLGYNGSGIKIGIIDTGVDYTHPALGKCFGKGCKIAYGYDLVGDDYTGKNTPIPDSDPYDNCSNSSVTGHGTHVAGIIGALAANITGVAYGSTLGMWRVFGCFGISADDVVIEALIQAYEAGMDIINLSLGELAPWQEDPVAIIASRIAQTGVLIVAANGNIGLQGISSGDNLASGNNVVAVASFDNAYSVKRGFILNNITYGYISANPQLKFPITKIAPTANSTHFLADACNGTKIKRSKIKGLIALVRRGECTFFEKALNVQKMGAIGILIYVRANETEPEPIPLSDDIKIPCAMISNSAGVAILNSKHPKGYFRDDIFIYTPISTSGTVTDFSSLGPLNELQLKPDIGGIGGSVYSTLPHYLGLYGTLSGTSMATPYISGAFALYLQAKGMNRKTNHKPMAVIKKFQNFAKYASISNNQTASIIDTPLRQGAGLVQVGDAIFENSHVTPGKLSFNDSEHIQLRYKLTVKNDWETTITYTFSNIAAATVKPYNVTLQQYIPLQPILYDSSGLKAKLTFFPQKLSIKAKGYRHVLVKVKPPELNLKDHQIYGGYIQITPDKGKSLHVPYIGEVGNRRELPILNHSYSITYNTSYPLLTDLANNVIDQKELYIFNRSDSTTQPTIKVPLLTGTAALNIYILNKNNKNVGLMLTRAYLPRDSYSFTWDGKVTHSITTVPAAVQNGVYKMKLSVLKIFGNRGNRSDYETWISPTIQVLN